MGAEGVATCGKQKLFLGSPTRQLKSDRHFTPPRVVVLSRPLGTKTWWALTTASVVHKSIV